MKWVGLIAWLVSSLAAINLGLAPFGFDFFQTQFIVMNPQFAAPICYLILASGLVSLALLIMACTGHHGCGKCNGKSKCSC